MTKTCGKKVCVAIGRDAFDMTRNHFVFFANARVAVENLNHFAHPANRETEKIKDGTMGLHHWQCRDGGAQY
jgi:hypothetical protein